MNPGSLDFVEPFPQKHGNNYILICNFQDPEQDVFLVYRTYDNGTQMKYKDFQAPCNKYKVKIF